MCHSNVFFILSSQSGESPSRKRRRTDVFDAAAVESLTPVELRFRNLVTSGAAGTRSPPELVPANSPRHDDPNGNPNPSPVSWRRSGPQVSVLQISPSSDLGVTIQVAEGAGANGSVVSSGTSRRLSQLSPVFVVNGSMSGVTFIGQAASDMVAPQSDLMHQLSSDASPHHGHQGHSPDSSAQGVNLWSDNNNSNTSNRRSVITHATSSGANSSSLTHDRNNNPLNESVSSSNNNIDGHSSDVGLASPHEDPKRQDQQFSSQSSSASVESLTDADAQSIENGSQMSDTQSIDSTAATIDSTSEASLAVFRGPVATSATSSNSADMSHTGYHHQQHQHSQGIQAFGEETNQILQLQAAAFRERSQSQSSQVSSVSSNRVSLAQRSNNAVAQQQSNSPNSNLQTAPAPSIANQSSNQQQHHFVNLPSGLRPQVFYWCIFIFFLCFNLIVFLPFSQLCTHQLCFNNKSQRMLGLLDIIISSSSLPRLLL